MSYAFAIVLVLCIGSVGVAECADEACRDGTCASNLNDLRKVLADSEDVADYVVRVRRELHLQPELMWTETKTSAVVKRELRAMGVSFEEVSAPGVVATIGSGSAPVVALRADMDALPVTEESDIPVERRSQVPGKMHACGHDGHTAMLLGAAKVLKSVEGSLRGTVRLVFQPAEEGGAGGRKMLEDGLRTMRPAIESSFALHNWPYPETPSGVVGTRPGTIMAGSGAFEITLTGAGGHAAVPHKNIDVVVCGSAVVMAMQTIVSRLTDPLDSALITVTVFDAGGDAENVMVDTARLMGQFHAVDKRTLEWIHGAIVKETVGIAAAHGCDADVTFTPVLPDGNVREEYPPTVNDVKAAALASSRRDGHVRRGGRGGRRARHARGGLLVLRRGVAVCDDVARVLQRHRGCDVAAAQWQVRTGRVGASQRRGDARGIRHRVHSRGVRSGLVSTL